MTAMPNTAPPATGPAPADLEDRLVLQFVNEAVACLRDDLDQLLAFFRFDDSTWRKAVRTTNAIERRFREVRRRTRPMGVFSDRTSIERILFAVFTHENRSQNVPPLFLVTQKS